MVKISKIRYLVHLSVLVAAALGLSACGGGGGSSSAGSPNGIYTGSITGGQVNFNGGEKAVIYNGKMLLFSMPGGMQQIFDMPFTQNGKNINGKISISNNSIPFFGTTTATGSFVAGQSVDLSFTDILKKNTSIVLSGTTPGTINLVTKTAGYNQGSNLNLLDNATWTGVHGGFNESTTITFTSTGDISGATTNEGCAFTGTTSIPDSTKNLYIISVVTSDETNCVSLPPSTYNGFAWFDEGDNNTLNFVVSDGSYARAIVLTRN